MVRDARKLGEQHAQILRAQRHLEPEQLLDREDVAVLLVERRAIVEAIEIGHVLEVGTRFHQLLGAAMQQADMRIDALDDLAVQLQYQTKHAMRGRMLRAEVDGVVLDLDVADGRLVVALIEHIGRDLRVLQFVEVGHQRFTSSALAGVGAPGA